MISDHISNDIPPTIYLPNANFEYGFPHSYALLQFCFKLESCKLHTAACQLTKCDIINDVKLFPTVYCIIYCHKFLMLCNQTLHYKNKCIRMCFFIVKK